MLLSWGMGHSNPMTFKLKVFGLDEVWGVGY